MSKTAVRTGAVPESPVSGRTIPQGGPLRTGLILVAVLAVLTTPWWLLAPPRTLGTPDRFRILALGVWIALGAAALMVGRDWTPVLRLIPARRTVTRELRSPWRSGIQWSYPGDQVALVSVERDDRGIARLRALLRGAPSILIDQGPDERALRALGRELARCWRVPFKS
jgi:hypothetical protein